MNMQKKNLLALALIATLVLGCTATGSDPDGYLPSEGHAGFLYFFTEG